MTLFTLAGALISAGYVCCAALATSAALHNRFFEGFLQNKKRDRARGQQQQQKEREKRMDKFIHVQRSCSKPTQMDMIAGFSLYLSPPLWLLAFFSLGLIRLHGEIEAIGEDS